MARSIDMSMVWNRTTEMLARHREAITAIAGLLIFVPGWANAHFVPPPDLAGLTTVSAMMEAIGQNFLDYWQIDVPLSLISFFGGIAVLTVMLRPDREHVGDALKFAAGIFPLYFCVAMLAALLISFGALAFLIGLIYVAGRLMIVGPLFVANPAKGLNAIKEAWEITSGNGWKCAGLLVVVTLVAQVIMAVISLLVGTLCALIAGPEGIPIVQHFVRALTATGLGVTLLALQSALYLSLREQA